MSMQGQSRPRAWTSLARLQEKGKCETRCDSMNGSVVYKARGPWVHADLSQSTVGLTLQPAVCNTERISDRDCEMFQMVELTYLGMSWFEVLRCCPFRASLVSIYTACVAVHEVHLGSTLAFAWRWVEACGADHIQQQTVGVKSLRHGLPAGSRSACCEKLKPRV